MADHDQRLKVTLREFLEEFVGLILPEWISRFRFAEIQWLQQELFLNPPRGQRRQIDLVALVAVTMSVAEANEMLLHVEIESGDSLTNLRQRMPRYHHFLSYQHDRPVLSTALYLDVGLAGIGWETVTEQVWDETLATIKWRYLGLPALEGAVYVEGENLLGVAFTALMRIDEERKAWLKARALQRIAVAELTPYRRFLLMDFVEAYLPLVGPNLDEYQRLLKTEEFQMVRVLGKTTFEEGMEKGMEKGMEQGRREQVKDQLAEKFGTLDRSVLTQLDAMPIEQIKSLAHKLLRAGTLEELGLSEGRPQSNGGQTPP